MTTVSFLLLLLLTFVSSSNGQSWEDSPLISNDTQLTELRALRQRVVDDGCDVNLCFAIDGSGSIKSSEFKMQKQFVDIIVNILATENPKNYCAVQYGTTAKPITALTSRRRFFSRKVRRTKRAGGFSDIAGALGFVGFQLLPRKGDANKIVILGDGFSEVGYGPMFVADEIRKEGIDICAVAVGRADVGGLNRITGDSGRVVMLSNFLQLAEIISAVVVDACGLSDGPEVSPPSEPPIFVGGPVPSGEPLFEG